jgi:hypothetical protein
MGARACGMCGYINNCSYKNTSICGPEYFMDIMRRKVTEYSHALL